MSIRTDPCHSPPHEALKQIVVLHRNRLSQERPPRQQPQSLFPPPFFSGEAFSKKGSKPHRANEWRPETYQHRRPLLFLQASLCTLELGHVQHQASSILSMYY